MNTTITFVLEGDNPFGDDESRLIAYIDNLLSSTGDVDTVYIPGGQHIIKITPTQLKGEK